LPPPRDEKIRRARAIELLAATVGDEKAQAVWDDAVRELGLLPADSFSREQVIKVFEAISVTPSLVGVAARYARLRLDLADAPPKSDREPPPRAVQKQEVSVDLLELIAPSVGEEKAKEAILQAARALGISPHEVTREIALQILDFLAKSPGLLGVAARFGKARFLLRHPG
jgi:hypothetical protein